MGIRTLFMDEMNRLRHDVLSMGGRVEADLGKALAALKTEDLELAAEVKANDAVVNALQLKIDDEVAILIATQQPVARDLRELVSILRITDNLERAGDHAVHLAKATKKLSGEAPFRQLERLERMVETGQSMLRGAMAAYVGQDVEAARRVAAQDDAIDEEHKALVEEILGLMREKPELVKRATKLIQVSGFLERLGDHVTNICEAIVYLVEGHREELNE